MVRIYCTAGVLLAPVGMAAAAAGISASAGGHDKTQPAIDMPIHEHYSHPLRQQCTTRCLLVCLHIHFSVAAPRVRFTPVASCVHYQCGSQVTHKQFSLRTSRRSHFIGRLLPIMPEKSFFYPSNLTESINREVEFMPDLCSLFPQKYARFMAMTMTTPSVSYACAVMFLRPLNGIRSVFRFFLLNSPGFF